jgi:hypothetical protein
VSFSLFSTVKLMGLAIIPLGDTHFIVSYNVTRLGLVGAVCALWIKDEFLL